MQISTERLVLRERTYYFDTKIELPLIRYGKRQRIETRINACARSIQKAFEKAKENGVEKIIDFRVLDVEKGIPGKFNLITMFDLVHDLKNPLKALIARAHHHHFW